MRAPKLAKGLELSRCDNCNGVHFVLIDARGKDYAEFILMPEHIELFAQKLIAMRDRINVEIETGRLQ